MGVAFVREPLVAFYSSKASLKQTRRIHADSTAFVHLCRLTFIPHARGRQTQEPVSCLPAQYHICRRISNENIWRRRSKHGIIVYITRVPSANKKKKTKPSPASYQRTSAGARRAQGSPPQCFPSSSSSGSSSNSDTDFPQCNVWTDLLC